MITSSPLLFVGPPSPTGPTDRGGGWLTACGGTAECIRVREKEEDEDDKEEARGREDTCAYNHSPTRPPSQYIDIDNSGAHLSIGPIEAVKGAKDIAAVKREPRRHPF